MKITLLQKLGDFTVGRIWIEDVQGIPVPRAMLGNVVCDVETKAELLEAGIASCNPVKLESEFPEQVLVRYEHSDGNVEEMILEESCADARLVAAVRKFHVLALAGDAQSGMEL